jgi:hypothetical protein
MRLGKFNNKVDTDDVPLIFWSLEGVKLSIRLMVLQLSPIAKVAGFYIDSYVSGHLGLPVGAQYEFECLEAACMSSDVHIVMFLHNVMFKVSVVGDIDLASEHE